MNEHASPKMNNPETFPEREKKEERRTVRIGDNFWNSLKSAVGG